MLENQLDVIENKGMFAGKAYYESLMNNEQERIKQLESEYYALEEAMNEALASGAIEENSEALQDMQSELNSVEQSWAECTNQLLEYKNQMREMDWSAFEKTIDYLSDIKDESEFIRDLMSVNENDLFIKDTGRLSDSGLASGALMAQNYDVNMGLAEKYRDKIEEINKELAEDPTNTILIDKKLEYIQAQRESIQAANEEKKNIQSLISDSYDRMLEVLQKLIDKRKDLLQTQKDLYDYEKNISDQTKNITDLRKQLMSIESDNSEEARSRRQQLQTSLTEAESNLNQTEYEQWLSDQEMLMDKLYTEYETVLNERLDNIDGLLQDMIDYGNSNSETVNQTITDATTSVGYTITEGMQSIWNNSDSGVGKILSEYSNNFSSTMTTITEYLHYIFNKMGGLTKEEAETKRLQDEAEAERKRQEAIKQQQAQQQAQQQQQQNAQNNKQVAVGGLINAGGATIYATSSGGGGGRQYFASDPIYTVIGENNGYWLVRHHNLSSGYTGWFKKSDVKAYATGGIVNYTGLAQLDGTRSKPERILSAVQTKAFETLVYNFLPKISDEILKLNNAKANISAIYGRTNGSNIENSIDLTLNLPNVSNSEEFVKALQTDKNIQKIIKSFTIDEAMGKNSLRKFNIK